MTDRIGFRLDTDDRAHLLAVAEELKRRQAADPALLNAGVNLTACMRAALKIAAETVRREGRKAA